VGFFKDDGTQVNLIVVLLEKGRSWVAKGGGKNGRAMPKIEEPTEEGRIKM